MKIEINQIHMKMQKFVKNVTDRKCRAKNASFPMKTVNRAMQLRRLDSKKKEKITET